MMIERANNDDVGEILALQKLAATETTSGSTTKTTASASRKT